MKKIGLLSDTHSMISKQFLNFFKDVDLILHAGDVGNHNVIEVLSRITKTIAVYGNIDGNYIRQNYSENLVFNVEDIKFFMTHIGGYPGKYTKRVKDIIERVKPNIYIAGHSHILKVIYDKKHDLLHLNPGAAGNFGYHKKATALKFEIHGKDIKNMEILEVDRSMLKAINVKDFISNK